MKDLGVIFDNELNFVQHCKEKINTAYSYLGIIKRNFIYLDEDYRPANRKFPFESNLELNRRLQFESNLKSNRLQLQC